MKQVLLFNPKSADYKFRIPNSVLQVAASIDSRYDWVIVDGNREINPLDKILDLLRSGNFFCVGFTVMPGPQLRQAIPFAKAIKQLFPEIKMVWGGYFASNQCKAVLSSGFVDVVINGPGDYAFPALLQAWETKQSIAQINNLIFMQEGQLQTTQKDPIPDYNTLPPLPYEKLNAFYSLEAYLGKTYLGTKTLAYHSSFGCPFTCSFCAVVPIYNARWKGMAATRIINDVEHLQSKYGVNAIEFHDNNFFVSEKRVREFAEGVLEKNIVWWGEGRIDTIDKYSDETLALMAKSGCKMIFFGAETGNDEVLKKMDKGGTQTGAQILAFAARMKKFGIVPEYSFVLGTPGNSPKEVWQQIEEDISFIKKVKAVNPATEIIIYVYSPVPTEGSDMYNQVLNSGFKFPTNLEDWLNQEWLNFDLRKNPLTPWLKPAMVDRIKNFETVLNGYYPTVSDIRLRPWQRAILKAISAFRYHIGIYAFPYEIKLLHKIWKYRQPEIQGF